MSYRKFIIPITDRQSLDGFVSVDVCTCPFCSEGFVGKSSQAVKFVISEHMMMFHRDKVLDWIKQKVDVDQELLRHCTESVIHSHPEQMPVDLWNEMPFVSSLSDTPKE